MPQFQHLSVLLLFATADALPIFTKPKSRLNRKIGEYRAVADAENVDSRRDVIKKICCSMSILSIPSFSSVSALGTFPETDGVSRVAAQVRIISRILNQSCESIPDSPARSHSSPFPDCFECRKYPRFSEIF